MTIFLTGGNGYLGSYAAHGLLTRYPDTRLALLVRAESPAHAEQRLWKAWQLHMDFEQFIDLVRTRCDIYLGDLTAPDLGLERDARDRLIKRMSSVLHIAASLNRKSSKTCFNVNLRGTLSVLKLARAAADHHGLRRFSDISTTAVCGTRQSEVVAEHDMIDWSRSDYDPYARTKKFCEHMVHELLPDVKCTVFRPSTVLGDSRFPETTQFDMTRAFVTLVKMPVLPLSADWRHDVVPADFVSDGIVTVHQSDAPKHDSYNLSTGDASPNYQTIIDALAAAGLPRRRFAPWLARPFEMTVEGLMSTPRGWGVQLPASLMKVFWPYLTFNTVFDNSRIVEALGGRRPAPFTDYAYGLFRFANEGGFKYPHKPWPETVSPRKVA